MADLQVREVLEFLKARGFNRAASALRDGLCGLDAAGMELDDNSFPPPVKVLPPKRSGAGFRSSSSSISDDAFLSMGSSSLEPLNICPLWSPEGAGSEDSSVRHSEFGTAREYDDPHAFDDACQFDHQRGYCYAYPRLIISNDAICGSEDKFMMFEEDDERFEVKKSEILSNKYDYVTKDSYRGCSVCCSSPRCDCCNKTVKQFELWGSVVYASYRIMDDDTEIFDECGATGCELRPMDRPSGAEASKVYLTQNQDAIAEKEVVEPDVHPAIEFLNSRGAQHISKDCLQNERLPIDAEIALQQVSEKACLLAELPNTPKEFQDTGAIRLLGEDQVENGGILDYFAPLDEYDVFDLRIVHRKNRTGFEESKDLPIIPNSVLGGRYYVTEYLGSAAFSKVVQAHDLQTHMDVCLKIIKNDKDFFDQSLDEIKLLKYVNKHDPNDEYHLLRLYDYFYHQEHLIIVCELLRENLYEFQKNNREAGGEMYFTLPRIQAIARQCLEALDYLHCLKIIHCDLKPENILIKSYSRCEIKVIDLGSSCFLTDTLGLYVQSRSYRAPEVILGVSYDPKIDVWSLGCILAELYNCEVLFPNEDVVMMLARMVGILGPIDAEMLAMGQETDKYFTDEHDLYYINEETNQIEYLLPEKSSLARVLGTSDARFVDFLKNLLQINPRRRPTAREALAHQWLSFEYE